jgi:UDP-glucose 4-epimerase
MAKKVLITGSTGLIGSESVRFFCEKEFEVFGIDNNMRGSRFANISILEAIELCQKISRKKLKVEYEPKNRIGDHIWWISDVSKFKKDYPDWDFKYSVEDTLIQIYETQKKILTKDE